MEINVLVVEDEKYQRERLQNLLSDEGYLVDTAPDGNKILKLLEKKTYHIVLLDMILPGLGGIEILTLIKQNHSSIQVIMLTAHGTIKTAIDAMKLGAYDYITKPYDLNELLSLIKRASEYVNTVYENNLLRSALDKYQSFPNIIWRSKAIDAVMNSVTQVAGSDSAVLIQGESGTGKELIAKAIHKSSLRKGKPFITTNCAAFQDTLLESELFGYEKGAFTGAGNLKYGLVEMVNGGTLFLDEVGDLSPAIQAKLLRFTESGEFRRVGGNSNIKVNVRLISATNKDIEGAGFRKDLLYRLNVFNIYIPPLRERKEDILLLAQHFLSTGESGKDKSLSSEASKVLLNYDWPGNVRELQNVIEQALIVSKDKLITPESLRIKTGSSKKSLSMTELEKEQIIKALREHNDNREQAANALGISERSLYRKIKEYNIS
ncbi:MAG: sigma-54 dependent transcriptional regulator [bacterium]